MKCLKGKIFSFFIGLFSVISLPSHSGEGDSPIIARAMQEDLPILAMFIGPGWCPWSKRLVEEMIDTGGFDPLASQVVIWTIPLSQDRSKEEEALCRRYQIASCPTLLLLDPSGREFARFSDAHFDPASYVEKIQARIEGFQEVCEFLTHLPAAFHEETWKRIYEMSLELSNPAFERIVLEEGVKREQGTYFHLRKYGRLLERADLNNPAVKEFRKKVLKRDPSDLHEVHFMVACLDSQRLKNQNEKGKKVVRPLLEYVKKFKKRYPERADLAQAMVEDLLKEGEER